MPVSASPNAARLSVTGSSSRPVPCEAEIAPQSRPWNVGSAPKRTTAGRLRFLSSCASAFGSSPISETRLTVAAAASSLAMNWVSRAGAVALRLLRHRPRRMLRQPRRHRRRPLGSAARGRAAHPRQDPLARAHRRPCDSPAFHWSMKVRPWGAGKSRSPVQPPPNGSLRSLPRPPAISRSARAPVRVASR